MTRRKLPPERVRSVRFKVAVSRIDHAMMTTAATSEGLTVPEWARLYLLRAARQRLLDLDDSTLPPREIDPDDASVG